MGSPLGPTLADIFLGKIKEQLSNDIAKCTLYKRYVDDILLITDAQQFDGLLTKFNSAHPNLSVSHEAEKEGCIPFLDILLSRQTDGSVRRRVYRKATSKAQYLNFDSFAPIAHKRGLVRTLFDRARRICTSEDLLAEENQIRRNLISNGYPEKFIQVHSRVRPQSIEMTTAPKKEVVLTLPYKGDYIANDIRQKIKSALDSTYLAASLRLFQTTQKLRFNNCVRKNSDHLASHVIYQFTCSCGDKYIGRTDRQLSERISEHIPKYLSRRMDVNDTTQLPPQNRNPASSIAKHLLMEGHIVDQNQAFRVLLRNPQPRLLAFYEAMLIRIHSPVLCAQKHLKQTLRLPWT